MTESQVQNYLMFINRWKIKLKKIKTYVNDNAEKIKGEELLTLPVDVLVPAAKEDVITDDNAGNIQARLIVEGANGPTAASADEIINDKGIMVVPDILANAGGVTVSYFEWVQNRIGYSWTLDRINRRTDRIMKDAFDKVYAASQKYKVNMRIAAYIVAIDKVASTYKFRGGYWSENGITLISKPTVRVVGFFIYL